jgi:hypothetical protein
MSLSVTAPLEFLNRLPLEAPFELVNPPTGAPRPELAGSKVRVAGRTPIYVIDRLGYRRLIPFPLTFMNLFKDESVFQGVVVASGVADIPEGPALDEGALLVRGRCSERIYLLDQGRKHPIKDHAIMDKYDFDEESVVAVPQILIDAVPEGEPWE